MISITVLRHEMMRFCGEACSRVTPCFCLSIIVLILPRLRGVKVASKEGDV